MDIPDVAMSISELLNGLIVLRCVVGGTSVAQNDSWKFLDTSSSRQPMASPHAPTAKKVSKWSKVAKSVKTSSGVETAMRDALVAVHASQNKPMANSMAKGGSSIADVDIPQDPTVQQFPYKYPIRLIHTCKFLHIAGNGNSSDGGSAQLL